MYVREAPCHCQKLHLVLPCSLHTNPTKQAPTIRPTLQMEKLRLGHQALVIQAHRTRAGQACQHPPCFPGWLSPHPTGTPQARPSSHISGRSWPSNSSRAGRAVPGLQ